LNSLAQLGVNLGLNQDGDCAEGKRIRKRRRLAPHGNESEG
jgi:hypothetical protein